MTGRARGELLAIGRKYDFHVALLVFNIPEPVCLESNAGRERRVPRRVIKVMSRQLVRTLKTAKEEGFDQVFVFTREDIEDPHFKVDIRGFELTFPGPFDIIGDLHGCYDELVMLLDKLGYRKSFGRFFHPAGRRAVFLELTALRYPDMAIVQVPALAAYYERAGSASKAAGAAGDRPEYEELPAQHEI